MTRCPGSLRVAKPSRLRLAVAGLAGLALASAGPSACKSAETAKVEPSPSPEPAAAPPAEQAPAAPEAERFADLGAAVAAIIERDKPRILGFGEVHKLTRSAKVTSGLERFTSEVVPVLLEAHLSNLVLETWVERPECGPAQAKVDTQVRQDTERPPETENELTRLLRALDEAKVGRHGMAMTCEEYEGLLGDAGTVDYSRLLDLITAKLSSLGREVRQRSASDTLVALYGGALHNDRVPRSGTEGWSYAAALDEATSGGYVEVDLFVPELIADDPSLQGEPWFSLITSPALDTGVLLVRRAPRSWVLLARRGQLAPSPKGDAH